MSGFEVPGVIFGVLPFRKAIPHAPYDEKLCDFYTSFYWEASELKSHITTLFQHLPNLSEEKRAEILRQEGSSDWNKDPEVARSFSELLVSIDDQHDFDVIMKKVLNLLDKLIDDNSLKMTKADMGQTAMFLKLQKLQHDIDSGETKSRL
ncbi:uncharacterized protein C8A04DRAFT_32546 [Dichotomopilus funicola]|uniref:Uncharacterized protein n=1 Tax=Dichotomopilus funicola TaxID=1934379 RepID=A0AAN6UVY8_9PEZI|nr:hypothetical protein C8A04DRAFT_32546 [Dichotomopilus funicola]